MCPNNKTVSGQKSTSRQNCKYITSEGNKTVTPKIKITTLPDKFEYSHYFFTVQGKDIKGRSYMLITVVY